MSGGLLPVLYLPHLCEISLPLTGVFQLEDAPRLGTAHELPQGAMHGGGVGSLTGQPPGPIEQSAIEHETYTFYSNVVNRTGSPTARCSKCCLEVGSQYRNRMCLPASLIRGGLSQ